MVLVKNIAILLFCFGCLNARAQDTCTADSVRTEITINAPAATVWTILMDTKSYKDWNPYLLDVNGGFHEGRFTKFTLIHGSFSAKILSVKPNSYLAWGGSALFFFRAKHYFLITQTGSNQCTVIQCEAWTGWFGHGFGKKHYQEACSNFKNMMLKMKERAEALSH